METVIKAFTGVFFSLLIVYLGVGIISSSVDARNADSFMADCVSKIENSNYAQEVIDACKEDAGEQQYELIVDTCVPEGSQKAVYGTATLKYEYTIPIIGMNAEHTINADLR